MLPFQSTPGSVFLVNYTPAVPLALDVNQTAVALYKAGGVLKEDARILQKQDVDSDALPFLNEEVLTKMGVPTFGRRVKILKAAQALLSGAAGVMQQSSPSPLSVSSPMQAVQAVPRQPAASLSQTMAHPRRPSPSPEPDTRDDMYSPPVVQGAPADDSAGEPDDEEDEDLDYEDERLRAAEEKEAKLAAKAAGGEDDDLFAVDEEQTGESFMAVKPWIGVIRNTEPSDAPPFNPAPPSKKLVIDHVHGYRGFDSRSNLVYNKEGSIVYPIAGLCVVYDGEKKQRYFQGHNDDVRCMARHPTNANIMASGQNATVVNGRSQPPHVCVWDSSNPEEGKMFRMDGVRADRAIRAVGFIADGKLLVSVSNDDNHMVKVWDWRKQRLVCEAKGDQAPIWGVRANPRDPTEFVTIGSKHLMFWRFDGSRIKSRRAQLPKPLTFYSVAFSESGFTVAGASDGNAYVFKGNSLSKTLAWHPKGKVLSIEAFQGGFVSGGSDKTVRVWDNKLAQAQVHTFSEHVVSVCPSNDGRNLLVGTRAGDVLELADFMRMQPLQGDSEPMENVEVVTRGHADGELWALAVVSGGNNFVTAGEDNTICLWDIPKRKMLKRSEISDKRGKAPAIRKASTMSKHPPNQCARGVAVSPDKRSIIVGTNNGEIAVFDTRTLQRKYLVDLNKYGKRNVRNQTGNWIETIQFSPSGRTVAVGTHGSAVCLLDPNDGFKCKAALTKSAAAITSIDWSTDSQFIQTNDLSYEILFYAIDEDDLSNSKHQTSASAMRDVQWASHTCKLGWPVQGIFNPSQKGSDINSCDASPNKTLVVTGDDEGHVSLFRYPALEGAKSAAFTGHSSHVVTTRFTPDEKYVISTGGYDKSIIQWAIQ